MSKAVVDAVRLNRRQFLQSLAAVGATIALPIGIAEATAAQVDEAWAKLAKHGTRASVRSKCSRLASGGLRWVVQAPA